jgi:hypothetical protein
LFLPSQNTLLWEKRHPISSQYLAFHEENVRRTLFWFTSTHHGLFMNGIGRCIFMRHQDDLEALMEAMRRELQMNQVFLKNYLETLK